MKACVIGVGRMGGALLESLKGKGIKLFAVSRKPLDLGGVEQTDYASAVSCDAVIVCVKPPQVKEVLASLSGHWPTTPPLVISIASKVSLRELSDALPGNAQVVRAMPNIAAPTGKAIVCFAAGENVTSEGMKTAESVLGCVGEAVRVEEKLLAAITALNGCGPAYFFHFAKTLEKSGVKLGLSEDLAKKIVLSLLAGSGAMAGKGKSLDELISSVATPGGSTEAALEKLEENGFQAMLSEALAAAKKRCDDPA